MYGFTHILGLVLSPASVGIERVIAYARLPGVLLDGFYELDPGVLNTVPCGEECVRVESR